MRTISILLLIAAVLPACEPRQENTPLPPATSSASSDSSIEDTAWKSYHDEHLGISIEYPFPGYTVRGSIDSSMTFWENEIFLEGFSIGDDMAEGNGVRVYRTQDPLILDYLQESMDFVAEKKVNGVPYQEFRFEGMGDVYGYVTEKNGYYYVLESMWGPENPVTEKMLEMMQYD